MNKINELKQMISAWSGINERGGLSQKGRDYLEGLEAAYAIVSGGDDED